MKEAEDRLVLEFLKQILELLAQTWNKHPKGNSYYFSKNISFTSLSYLYLLKYIEINFLCK